MQFRQEEGCIVMKKGLMLLMLAACLFVGCGNEKTTVKPEVKKAGEVQKTEMTSKVQETPKLKETPKHKKTSKPKKTEEPKEPQETKKPIAKNGGTGKVYDVNIFYYDPNYNYRKITNVSDLKKNIKMKTNKRKIKDIEKEDVKCKGGSLWYECELDCMFKKYVVDKFDWDCEAKLDDSYMTCENSSYGADFITDNSTCIVPSGLIFYDCDNYNTFVREDNMFAVVNMGFSFEEDTEHICIADMKNLQYYLVDFRDLIANEFGVCGTNPNCEGFNGYDGTDTYNADEEHMMFLDENRLVVRTNCNHLFVYDIRNEELTDCIWLGFNVERVYLKDGICNVTYEMNDGSREFIAIDVDKREVVANIKGDLGEGKYVYRKGVIYYLNAKGLYAYNCETKGYDAIYDKMADNTKYPDIKKEDSDEEGEWLLNYQMLFEGDEIYLCRGIFTWSEGVLWKELFYRKLTME